MVRIDLVYEGGLHTRAQHGPSGAELVTDAPKDNEGRGEAFSPTDLLATSLGSCVLTVMGIVARRRGWPLEGARAAVEKHMVANPQRRVGRLVLRLEMPPDIPPDARRILERTARTCPVHASLHPDLKVEFVFAWGAGGAGPA